MKRYLLLLLTLVVSFTLNSCLDEPNADLIKKINDTPPAAAVATYTVGTAGGAMIIGTPVSDVTQILKANVTRIGTYNLTATANGVTFSTSGLFTTTGSNQMLVLTATGKPTAGGKHTFASTSPAFSFERETLLSTAEATYTIGTAAGTMTAGTLVSGVTQTLIANVTKIGGYSLTATANGVTFGGSGSFTTTGTNQTVVLTATGTPTAGGKHTFASASPAFSFERETLLSTTEVTYTAGTATGTMTVNTPVSGVTQTLIANVTKIGGYSLTATANGITFAAFGSFTTVGTQNVVLTATGTPIAGGTHTFASTAPTFSFTRETIISITEEYFTIPDANFAAKLKTAIPAAFAADGRLITNSEIVKTTTYLSVSNQNGTIDSIITNLSGIEYFTALTFFRCDSNQLTSIDVSKNTALTTLWCSSNQLTSLDVSKNVALKDLTAHSNQLTTLDVSKNNALTHLSCDNNQLTTIDVSNNTALEYFYCRQNKLNAVDVSKNTSLLYFSCNDNQLTRLDVSKNTALTNLECGNLTTLDLSNNTALIYLYCVNSTLSTLDLSKNTALTWLYSYNNQLTTLDISSQKQWGTYDDGSSKLSINASSSSNSIVTLKVNAAQKQHDEIKAAKTARGSAITISTYTNSSAEAPVCGNYNPNTDTCP